MNVAVRETRWIALLAALAAGCGSEPIDEPPAAMPGTGGTTGGDVQPSDALTVAVSATRATYVKLGVPALVGVTDAATSTDWDLGFEGYDVLTNGGLSGPGAGS